MCRNIRPLHNFDPPATEAEARDAALQYVRKVSGFTKPSQANEEAFARAVDAIAGVTTRLLDELVTGAPPKNREEEAAKARARSAQRYAAYPARARPLSSSRDRGRLRPRRRVGEGVVEDLERVLALAHLDGERLAAARV